MLGRKNQLYLKISAILLSLLVVIGILYILISSFVARNYLQEVNQRLYGNIADSTVQQIKPLVNGKVDTLEIQDLMHSMMVINPSVEVYLLDTEGHIITYVAPKKRVKLDKVDLGPVQEFIQAGGQIFIRGQDPRHPGSEKVFSAAPLMENDSITGYIYIILASEEQASVTATLFNSYMLKLGTRLFLISLAGALIIGLFAIWLLTRNLRRVIQTVKRFQEGDLKARISEKDKGDLTVLANTFNEMADTIVANIEQLKSVETLRRELIANVSHDLRTPLAILQGYVETLQMKENSVSPEERSDYLKTIMNSSEKLSALITQLFEYSKLEARQVEPNKEPFFLSELAQDTLQKFKVLAGEKNIDLSLEMQENLPLVFADLALVDRVIQNLMDNAIKFTPEGGKVQMELLDLGHAVEVKIADTGPGIPEADQRFIFERYHKAERNEQKNKGAGLGLAIAKKILELHDATIRVQSRINEGTTFMFQLPAFVG